MLTVGKVLCNLGEQLGTQKKVGFCTTQGLTFFGHGARESIWQLAAGHKDEALLWYKAHIRSFGPWWGQCHLALPPGPALSSSFFAAKSVRMAPRTNREQDSAHLLEGSRVYMRVYIMSKLIPLNMLSLNVSST